MNDLQNRLTLQELRQRPLGDLLMLPANELILLQYEAAETLRRARLNVAWLEAVQRWRCAVRPAETCCEAAKPNFRQMRTEEGGAQ